MNGIYPDYVGPTIAYRFESLYPDWVGDNLDIIEVEVDTPGGSGSKSLPDDLKSTRHGRRLLREDEEILTVLMAAIKVMQ